VVNADGSDQSRLTDYPQTSLPYQGSFDPTFSPQGKLVLQSSRLYNSEILLMNAGGSDISSLTLNKTGDVDPAFSPDGSQITFATEPTVGNFDVYTMGPDGSDKTPLTKDPARDRSPAYSPDGSTIAFTSDGNGNNDIYVMGSDGSNQKRLTESPGFESNPVFTPTGDRIVFESNRESPGLYAMDSDGSNETRLTNSVGGRGRSHHFAGWGKDSLLRSFPGGNSRRLRDELGRFEHLRSELGRNRPHEPYRHRLGERRSSCLLGRWHQDGLRQHPVRQSRQACGGDLHNEPRKQRLDGLLTS
jgi:Tol biopolymer transport system component